MPALLDLKGHVFGDLLVIEHVKHSSQTGKKHSVWKCKCKCGNIIDVRVDTLRNGKKKTCGCDTIIQPGDVIFRLTVVKFLKGFTKNTNNRQTYWLCKCSCGKETIVSTSLILRKRVKSCGCYRKDFDKIEYGDCKLKKFYWTSILNGAKSRSLEITVTPDYIYNLFLLQDGKCALSKIELILPVSQKQNGTASLDRIDNTKGYIEGNLRWVHKKINQIKMDLPDNVFIYLCKIIAANNELDVIPDLNLKTDTSKYTKKVKKENYHKD